MNRHSFTPSDTVGYVWTALGLPKKALESLHLPIDVECCPSSFKVGHLAQASVGLSALSAALVWSVHNQKPVPHVTVPAEHACAEFKSERLYVLNGRAAPSTFSTIGGLHKTGYGYIRMHDGFPNHRENALKILGLNSGATRDDVAQKMLEWNAIDLETEATRKGAVMAALRSFEEWDALPQARAIADFPILVSKIAERKSDSPKERSSAQSARCLQGIRVVEMSRVIAAPVAGKTLAAHGADVLWITSPSLPDLPELDIDVSRGKRTVQLDIKQPEDKAKLLELLSTADVFIQSYRPGSLAAQGLSNHELLTLNPSLIIASLSAYGPDGPWSQRRGFDSLVQTCSGLNVADAEQYGLGEAARVLPCQALDHSSGYMLAAGIMAALYRRNVEGGSYEVKVSLAGVMHYLRSLGREAGFDRRDFKGPDEVCDYLETRATGFGELKAIRHSARIEGLQVGWEHMPKPLGSDAPAWL
ncbi:hypothetical protein SVAN01_08393 [Stagonosporopsis vannaccii]|nr:hypothetical protein SVAN01_08393 [Stagonosporopsis vannaccii]